MLDAVVVKKALEARLQTLEVRVNELQGKLRSEHSANFSEQAAERENDEVMEKLETEGLDEINAIRSALGRLESDNYGVCTRCGEEIGEKRLEILPYASCCVRCAK